MAQKQKFQKLTPKALAAQENFLAKLGAQKRTTSKPVAAAIVGLVGSGKSSVAREFAKHTGAVVISGDDIRVELRKQNEAYEYTGIITENAAIGVIKQGGNAVLDGDFADTQKRDGLKKKIQKQGIRLVFIRTYCDFDVAAGRILTTNYQDKIDDFFGGASSTWHGDEQTKGAVVKIREMWRRTPHHYRWLNESGGKWKLRKFPFTLFAQIDTTDENNWKLEVEKCAKKLK